MTTTALTATTDRTPTTTKLTAKDIFNIWLADQSELTQTVYKAEVTAFLEWALNLAVKSCCFLSWGVI